MVRSKLKIITHSNPGSPVSDAYPLSISGAGNGLAPATAGLRLDPSRPSTSGARGSAQDELSPTATMTSSDYTRALAMPTDVGPFMPPGTQPLPPVAPLKLTRKSSSPKIGSNIDCAGVGAAGAAPAVDNGTRARSGSGSAGETSMGGTLRRASVDEAADSGSGRKRSGSLSKEKANERWADAIAAYPLPPAGSGNATEAGTGPVALNGVPAETHYARIGSTAADVAGQSRSDLPIVGLRVAR